MAHGGGGWPDEQDYCDALRVPGRVLGGSLGPVVFDLDQYGEPLSYGGNFGVVFRYRNTRGQSFALKAFTKRDDDRDGRGALIHAHLAAAKAAGRLPWFVRYDYSAQGIAVPVRDPRRRWPIVSMEWVEGKRLDQYLSDHDGHIPNGTLCRRWTEMLLELGRQQMAHGDLQQGNILMLSTGEFRLVDYDGMFVPAMRRRFRASEVGLPAFQHPGRRKSRGAFNERLDDFSALVILLTLACLRPNLWKAFYVAAGRDDRSLLFTQEDWEKPDRSRLLSLLAASPDAPIRKLALITANAANGTFSHVPRFADIAADRVVAQVLDPSWQPRELQLKRPPRPKPRQQPRCRSCHAFLRAGAKYCGTCRTQVSETGQPRPPLKVLPPPVIAPPPPVIAPLPPPAPVPTPGRRSAAGWFVAAAVVVVWFVANRESGESTAPPEPVEVPVQTEEPVQTEIGLAPAPVVERAPPRADAASVRQAWVEPYVMPPQLPFTSFHTRVHVSFDVSAAGRGRVCVIARFFFADGSAMPGAGEYVDPLSRQAAVWDFVEFDGAAAFDDFVLTMPQHALAPAQGIYAEVAIEDASRTRLLASAATPRFENSR